MSRDNFDPNPLIELGRYCAKTPHLSPESLQHAQGLMNAVRDSLVAWGGEDAARHLMFGAFLAYTAMLKSSGRDLVSDLMAVDMREAMREPPPATEGG